ncbi:MAG: hypothetical protein JXB85_18135 [Anaerolineales bacterium]|nr:hypothetical protein [Anaerolineales bacterium]
MSQRTNNKQWMILAVIGCTLLFFLRVSPAMAAPRLEILGESIMAEPEDAVSTSMLTVVTVRNNGEAIDALAFRAVSNEGGSIVVYVQGGTTSIGAFAIAQFILEFPDLVSEETSGYLVVEAAGIEPAFASLTLKPLPDLPPDRILGVLVPDINWILVWSFIVGFVLLFVASLSGIFVKFKREKKLGVRQTLACRMKGLKWKFEENWASTFVAVGGLLNVVASSKIIPEKPVILGEHGFQALNTLFPILIVLAPFLLSALNAIAKEPKKNGKLILEEDGKTPLLVLPFVIGSAVVTWAVVGELLTLIVLFQELFNGDYISGAVTQVSQVMFLLIGLLGLFYAWEKIIQTSLSAKTPEELQEAAEPSGIVKASRGVEKVERPVYLP